MMKYQKISKRMQNEASVLERFDIDVKRTTYLSGYTYIFRISYEPLSGAFLFAVKCTVCLVPKYWYIFYIYTLVHPHTHTDRTWRIPHRMSHSDLCHLLLPLYPRMRGSGAGWRIPQRRRKTRVWARTEF